MRLDGAFSRGGFSTISVIAKRLALGSCRRRPRRTGAMRSIGTSSTAMMLAIAPRPRDRPRSSAARQPGLCCTSTSGSSSANGSLPTSSRAHQTAWPRPSGDCWRVKLVVPGRAGRATAARDRPCLLRSLQRHLQLELAVEMVLDHRLVAAGDEDEMLDAGLARLVDHVLDQRPVDHRQHLLGHRLGGGQEAGAEARHRENRFANRFHVGRIMRESGGSGHRVLAFIRCYVGDRTGASIGRSATFYALVANLTVTSRMAQLASHSSRLGRRQCGSGFSE